MNISAQQKQKLYHYLDGIFTYRESLAEVYDHILSGAEKYEGPLAFEDQVTSIINEDFGGHQQLHSFEKQYKCNARKEMNGKMRRMFLRNVFRKGWIPLAPAVIFLFYLRINIFSPVAVWSVAAVYFAISIGHYFYMRYRNRRVYAVSKKSFRTYTLGTILNMPVNFNPLLIVSLKGTQYLMEHATHFSMLSTAKICYLLILMLLMYVLYPIFLYTFFQLFKKDYTLKPVIK